MLQNGDLKYQGGRAHLVRSLNISGVSGAPAPHTLPLGGTSKAASTGLNIISSFAGGEDNTNGTDSTGRINVYSYQRAATHSFGETFRHFLMRKDSKSMFAWYGAQLTGTQTHGYDGNRDALTTGVSWNPWAWIGAHYEANDHASTHGHISIEVPDTTGALQTRFEILFADRTTGEIGLEKTFIITNQADFVVRCSSGQVLRMAASAGNEKAIEFNNDSFGASASRRWKIRTTSTAESGSNAGSDFQVVRYDDAGTAVDSPIEVVRSSGQVVLGPTGGVLIQRSTGVALQVTPTATGGQGVLTTGTDATARAYQGNVSGDGTNRYVAYVDGKLEWGPGNAARDTNLYRSAASTLTTDDLFTAVGVSSTTAGATAAATFANSADGTASLGTVVVNPFSTSKRALDIRLAADSVSRLRVDFSQGSGAGTLVFGDGTTADVALYRTTTATLRTNGSITVDVDERVGRNLQVGSTSLNTGGGNGALGIANASVVPTTNPTGGGVLYSEGGALKWRGSSGTITTIAAA
jgi:hypothetical protein